MREHRSFQNTLKKLNESVSCSVVSNSFQSCGTCQAPLSMGFSRQEYGSGLPCPPPGCLPNPGTEPTSTTSPALAGRLFTTSATWEALSTNQRLVKHPHAFSAVQWALLCHSFMPVPLTLGNSEWVNSTQRHSHGGNGQMLASVPMTTQKQNYPQAY